MFDVKEAVKLAHAELAKEQSEKAKGKIKESLKKIASAKAVLANLEREHEVILREIGSE